MTFDNHKNFAVSTIAVAPNPPGSGLALILVTGGGKEMPVAPFNATVYPAGVSFASASNAEIVRVESVTGDNIALSGRAQEGSKARLIQPGDQFAVTITVKTLTDIEEAVSGDNSAVAEEKTRALAAEAGLASNINSEKAARETAVTAAIATAEAASDAAGTAAADVAVEKTARETAVTGERTRAESVEATNASAISAEKTRAEGVEASKAPTASPALTGTPTAPTASPGDNTTKIATTAYVGVAAAGVASTAAGEVSTEKTRAMTAEGEAVKLTGNQSISGVKTFTGEMIVPEPTGTKNAVSKAYADALATGLKPHEAVKEATKEALPANSYATNVITATSNGALSIDGIALSNGERVLIKNEATESHNGIYVVTNAGGVSAKYVLTRAADMMEASQIAAALVFVEKGTENENTSWSIVGSGPWTIGTTPIQWTLFSRAGTLLAGTGLTKTGSTLSVNYGTGSGTATQGNDSRVVNAASKSELVAEEEARKTAIKAEEERAKGVEATKAPLASPIFTGTPVAPTPSASDNTTKIATTEFVGTAVSAAINGLNAHPNVQWATKEALPANAYLSGVITGSALGALSIDSGSPSTGQRILVKNEAAEAHNGLYVVTHAGSISEAFVLTRATDMSEGAQVAGAFVLVEQGTINRDTGWFVASPGPFTLGTTAIPWSQFTGPGSLTAGEGIVVSGNQISVSSTVSSGLLNLTSPWSNIATYNIGETPSRYGILYKAISSSTGVDPVTDNGTHWRAIGYAQGHGPIFNGDWHNTPYGNIGANSPKVAITSNVIGDYDHVLTQEANRLQYVAKPALRGTGSVRAEARQGDYGVSGRSRTEVTGTSPGKQWFPGDEIWLTLGYLFDPNYPLISGTGKFHIFHQNYAQDNYAQGGGSTTIAENVTLPQARISVEPYKARSLLSAGTFKIGSQTVTYTSRSVDGRFIEGCTGGEGSFTSGTEITQSSFTTTLAEETTFPTETVHVVSTEGATPSGILETSTGVPFTYTSKDATHFLGCKGGASSESPVKVASGTTVGGTISGGSPALAFQFSTSGGFFQLEVRGGNKPLNPNESSPHDTSVGLGASVRGAWRVWMAHLVLSTEENGLVEVWERTGTGQYTVAPQASISGPNVQSSIGHVLPFYLESNIYSGEGPETLVSYHGGLKVALNRLEAESFWTEAPPQSVNIPLLEEEGTTNAQKTLLFPETPNNGQTFVGAKSNKTWVLKGKTSETEGTWEVSSYPGQQPALRKLLFPLVYENGVVSGETALGTANKAQFARARAREAGVLKSIWVANGATVAGNTMAAIFDTGQAKAGEYSPLWSGEAVLMAGASKWQMLGEPKLTVTPNQEILLGFMSSSTTATFGRGSALLNAAYSELFENALVLPSGAKPKLAGTRSYTEAKWAAFVEVNLNTTSQPFIIACLYE